MDLNLMNDEMQEHMNDEMQELLVESSAEENEPSTITAGTLSDQDFEFIQANLENADFDPLKFIAQQLIEHTTKYPATKYPNLKFSAFSAGMSRRVMALLKTKCDLYNKTHSTQLELIQFVEKNLPGSIEFVNKSNANNKKRKEKNTKGLNTAEQAVYRVLSEEDEQATKKLSTDLNESVLTIFDFSPANREKLAPYFHQLIETKRKMEDMMMLNNN